MAQVVTPKVEKPQAASKLLYILVQDDPEPGAKEGEQGPTHRYTRGMLQSTLQFMGCKARHATKVLRLLEMRVLIVQPDVAFHSLGYRHSRN